MTGGVSILISLGEQTLTVLRDGEVQERWYVSTALKGPGEQEGSGCTPRGEFAIAEKIGEQAAINSVFVGRKPTGEIYSEALSLEHPQRDWILTRILWLRGCEPGKNLGGAVDTQARYIYIHGTPDTEPMGVPLSHGCIRMRNTELIALFDQVDEGTQVRIIE